LVERASRSGPRPRRTRINAILFIATLVSVFLAGALFLYAPTLGDAVCNGLAFMAALMGILVCHEAGHFLMARRNRVDASLPYFIPIPPIISMIGTMGAVIVMRGRIRSRNALMEVGAAGPLAGMAIAVPILLAGLARCPVGPIPDGGWIEGQSLLYLLAKRVVVGPIPDGFDIYVDQSPLAWAGWIGLLVTTLNLIPIGQLDGGHVFYALFGQTHARASRIFHIGLFALGLGVMAYCGLEARRFGLTGAELAFAISPGFTWFFLGAFLFALGRFSKTGLRHPPTDDDQLSPLHRVLGLACLAVLVLTFMPILMRPVIS
jgi:membrane-associated protease RseP (regulator of RpoE activity)